MSHTFLMKFRVFKTSFLQKYLEYQSQIFRDSEFCYDPVIFSVAIFIAWLENDEQMLMRQKL